jgi:hypothetical protein
VSNATYKLLLTADAGGANLPNASYRAYNLSKGAAEVTAFQAALQVRSGLSLFSCFRIFAHYAIILTWFVCPVT